MEKKKLPKKLHTKTHQGRGTWISRTKGSYPVPSIRDAKRVMNKNQSGYEETLGASKWQSRSQETRNGIGLLAALEFRGQWAMLYKGKYFQPRNPCSRKPSTKCEDRIKTFWDIKGWRILPPMSPFSGSYWKIYATETGEQTQEEKEIPEVRTWTQTCSEGISRHEDEDQVS